PTTTSAGSVRSAEQVQGLIRAGAEPRWQHPPAVGQPVRRHDPAGVAAGRAAGVSLLGPAAERLLVPDPALEAPDAVPERLPSFLFHVNKTPGPCVFLRCALQSGLTAPRVASTSRAICATRASSDSNAASSRRYCQSSTTGRCP